MWKLTYKWAKHSHPNKPKHWIVRPVLRPVQQVQAGPVGVRRPRQRRLPAQVLLDEDRPAPAGQGQGVPGRPGPGSTTGPQRRRKGHPAASRRMTAAPASGAARPLPGLRRAPAARRPPAAKPTGMGSSGGPSSGRRSPSNTIAFPGGEPPDDQRIRLLHTHCQRRNGAAAMTKSSTFCLPASP